MRNYLVLIWPALLLSIILLLLLPKDLTGIRICVYIIFFIWIRDAMTPAGIWRFGKEGFFWLRFNNDPFFLILFGLFSLGLAWLINWLEAPFSDSIIWVKENWRKSILWGMLGCCMVLLFLLPFYLTTPLSQRGGTVSWIVRIGIFFIAIFGNLLEEILFRGLLQTYTSHRFDPKSQWKAALLSGLFFAFGHGFLAFTVTNVGLNIIIFALLEGVVCGFIQEFQGLIAATITHGFTIFVLASAFF